MRKKTLELMRYIAEDLNESYISGYSHIFAYDFIPYNRVKYIKQLLKRAGVIVPVTGWKWLEDKAAEWKVTKLFPEWYDKLKEVPYVNLYEEWKKEPLPPSDKPLASEIRLSSKYHKRVSIKSIEWAEEQLSLSYPWLKEYQQKVEDINSRQPSLPMITFSPKITADGALLKKVSIRWANCMTGKKKSERHQWLQKLGLTEEFDVKNSIYKVTHLMNTGVWLPQSVDLYKSIWEVTKHRPVEIKDVANSEAVVAAWRGDNFTAEMRDIIKKCVMSAYFDSTEKLYLHHLKVSNKVSEWMKPFVKGLWTDMRAVVGQTYDNEVFFHESCIYIDVVDKLTQMGVTVWNCFDGFYFNNGIVTPDDVEQMVAEAAVNYYQKVQEQSVSLSNIIDRSETTVFVYLCI